MAYRHSNSHPIIDPSVARLWADETEAKIEKQAAAESEQTSRSRYIKSLRPTYSLAQPPHQAPHYDSILEPLIKKASPAPKKRIVLLPVVPPDKVIDEEDEPSLIDHHNRLRRDRTGDLPG